MEKELDEGRKRTLGVIAAIFACRKLSALDGKPHQHARWHSACPPIGRREADLAGTFVTFVLMHGLRNHPARGFYHAGHR